MKMTVGPLPPAVYWRRRAVLLAVLLLVLFGFSRCVMSAFGDEKPGRDAGALSTSPSSAPELDSSASPDLDAPLGPTPDQPVGEPTDGASPSGLPGADPGATDPGAGGADGGGADGSGTDGGAAAPVVPAPARPSPAPVRVCAAAELFVGASPERPEYKVGTMPRLRLTVRNVSATPCVTDLGATRQELRVTSGGARIWSSDDCSPTRGTDLVALAAGAQRTYTMTWSGKTSTPRCATFRLRAEAGTYRVWARLGGTLSTPTVFRLV